MNNKKLRIPEIDVDKITLSRMKDCWIGDVYHEEIDCTLEDIPCDDCIFSDNNIQSGLLYLISKGYITKEEAMKVTLDA